MSYLFKSDRTIIRKTLEERLVLQRLRAFLDKKEPELVYWLVYTWNTQGKAITYKELREAILRGDISQDILEEWQQDYAAFVTTHLKPMYEEAMEAANRRIEAKYPDWHFDPMGYGVKEWTENRAAAFVTEVSGTQIEGLRTVIRRAAVLENLSVDQLARAIRPMVGLTDPQATANLKYFEKLIENGVKETRAQDLAAKYAARQHRYRAYNIARTELNFAYSRGVYEGTKQAQEKGYMGDCVKIWCTADDERVCKICGGLEGQKVGLDEEFNFSTKLTEPNIRLTPPAHPSCRCTFLVKEIGPPITPSSYETE